MPLEDFTTYTEVDPNNHITVSQYHIDHNAYRNEDAYVYKDKGSGFFTDFIHKVDVRSDFAQENALGVVWSLQNDLNDVYGIYNANKTCVYVFFYYRGADHTRRICLREVYNGSLYTTDWVGADTNTWYYLTIEKSGTSLTCKIYSDSARTNLLETLNLTLHGDWSFRYIFACNTYNSGHTYHMNVDVENLDLGIVPEETPISGKALYNAITIPETPISTKALYNVLTPNIKVIVTNESVTPDSGFVGDSVTYNAIVKDEYGNPLPEEFIADLLMNSTVVVDNQSFIAGVYNPSTGELTLVFTVPSLPSGTKTVKLKWEEQTI